MTQEATRREQRLAAVKKFVRPLCDSTVNRKGAERRLASRYPYVQAVAVMPVDPVSELPLYDDLIDVVARDISTSGIAFVHPGAFKQAQIAVRLTRIDGESIMIRTRVARVRPVGRNHYEVAGEFLERIDAS